MWRPRLAALSVLIALVAAGAGGWPAGARADGDPASDVLAIQKLFLPADAAIPVSQQTELAGLVQEAGRAGLALRVAIIASPTDLGSITALWRQPENYARFLGQEIALVFRGTLLVVMPNGYGTYRFASGFTDNGPSVAGLPVPGARLGSAAISAVEQLGREAGHPLAPVSATASGSGGGTSVLPIIVFVLGGAVIIAAGILSLRRRPLARMRASR